MDSQDPGMDLNFTLKAIDFLFELLQPRRHIDSRSVCLVEVPVDFDLQLGEGCRRKPLDPGVGASRISSLKRWLRTCSWPSTLRGATSPRR